MTKKMICLFLVVWLLCGLTPTTFAADYYFTDRNGTKMVAPEEGFATRVVEFTPGNPWTSYEPAMDPKNVLGVPDYTGDRYTAQGGLTMGGGGVLVLEFSVAIYDGDGLDIYVFEVGEAVEDTRVEVSNDLVTWYDVGIAKGKTAGVDLNGKVPEGSRFRYVRLTDLRSSDSGAWPGADIDAVSGLNVKAISSAWAQSELDKAEELGLIPDILKNADMTKPITRAEFAAVSVKVYEALSGMKAIPAVNNPFTDTNDVEILKAYNIGSVNGISTTTFKPDGLLNREQAAAMMTRVFKRITLVGWSLERDNEFSLPFVQPALFSDDADISAWAKDSVYFMATNGIIGGVGNNRFAPRNTTTEQEAMGYANATREQALAIAVRMVENLG